MAEIKVEVERDSGFRTMNIRFFTGEDNLLLVVGITDKIVWKLGIRDNITESPLVKALLKVVEDEIESKVGGE